MMKDQVSKLGGDGASTNTRQYSCRINQMTSGTPSRSGNNNNDTPQKRNIPKFPESWRSGLGNSLFKLLRAWRSDAYWGRAQGQLNTMYTTVVEFFLPGSGKSKGGKSTSPQKDGTTAQRSPDGEKADSAGGGNDQSQKRIRLQKSRRIFTECST
jgi:hypothetical protein